MERLCLGREGQIVWSLRLEGKIVVVVVDVLVELLGSRLGEEGVLRWWIVLGEGEVANARILGDHGRCLMMMMTLYCLIYN